MIKIKIADISNAQLIAEISRETFYETFAQHNTQKDMDKFLTEQFNETLLMEQVGSNGNTFLLAYENNQPAGYVFLSEGTNPALNSTRAIEICRLYARTAFIGKGIGKALMEAAISFAQNHQKDCIWLGVWEHNQRAINFYKSFGFEKFGEHDFVLGDDVQVDWLMRLGVRGKDKK